MWWRFLLAWRTATVVAPELLRPVITVAQLLPVMTAPPRLSINRKSLDRWRHMNLDLIRRRTCAAGCFEVFLTLMDCCVIWCAALPYPQAADFVVQIVSWRAAISSSDTRSGVTQQHRALRRMYACRTSTNIASVTVPHVVRSSTNIARDDIERRHLTSKSGPWIGCLPQNNRERQITRAY